MANAYLNVYMNNPTADGTDGTQVSTDGANTSPISATLDASKAESSVIKCALRCESGLKQARTAWHSLSMARRRRNGL